MNILMVILAGWLGGLVNSLGILVFSALGINQCLLSINGRRHPGPETRQTTPLFALFPTIVRGLDRSAFLKATKK